MTAEGFQTISPKNIKTPSQKKNIEQQKWDLAIQPYSTHPKKKQKAGYHHIQPGHIESKKITVQPISKKNT